MVKREIIRAGEALYIWKDLKAEGKIKNLESEPLDRYVRRFCSRYEGILCYKISEGNWNIYKDVWIRFLTEGFPDLALHQPVMDMPTALRYLHKNGIPHTYKLREFRNDLKVKFPQWVISNKIERDRISRGHLHKFIGIWNGNR